MIIAYKTNDIYVSEVCWSITLSAIQIKPKQ